MRIFFSFLVILIFSYNILVAGCCDCDYSYTITSHFPSSYYDHINSPHFITNVTNGRGHCGHCDTSYSYTTDFTNFNDGIFTITDSFSEIFDSPLNWFHMEDVDANMLELELGEDDFDELNEDIFIGGQILFRPRPRMWLRKTIKAFNHEHFHESLCYINRYEKALIARGFIPYFPGKITRRQCAIINFYRNASKEMIRYGHLDSSYETPPFDSSYSDFTYDYSDYSSDSYGTNDDYSYYDTTELLLKAYIIQAKHHYKNGNVNKCKKLVDSMIKRCKDLKHPIEHSDNFYRQILNSNEITSEEKKETLYNLVTSES